MWKKSVVDIEGDVLCGMYNRPFPRSSLSIDALRTVSQFTLFASTDKGTKPSFHKSASGDVARELYEYFYLKVRELYKAERVKDGVFQAMMDVALVNDGPVRMTPGYALWPD